MSYEGTVCPCGDKKQASTMLCSGCEEAFANHPSMLAMNDKRNDVDHRRHAATTLLAMSRDRKTTPNRAPAGARGESL